MNKYPCKVLVFALALGGAATAALAAASAHPGPGMAARAVQPADALPAALQPAFYQALARDAGPAYAINKNGCAKLSAPKLTACFDDGGVHFTGSGSPLALHLVAWGREPTGEAGIGRLTAVESVKPAIRSNEAQYRHGDLTEWWRVLPVGFEQGFTIARRPDGNGRLTLMLAMSRQDAGAPSIRHSHEGGNPVNNTLAWGKLRYGKLVVTDARGKVVPATLTSNGDRMLIAVNDADATYPLTVDPLVWLEHKVFANDGEAYDHFGLSVALDGTTAIIGAFCAHFDPNSGCGPGAVYVFTESGGTWTQTQKLTASDGAPGAGFGSAVALDGATALVSAADATVNGNEYQGEAYLFNYSNGTWTQTVKLTANDGQSYDGFGAAVALDGATALVSAAAASVNGNSEQGAAYVFNEANGAWTQTTKLTASDGQAYDFFGYPVALDGTTALVGAEDATVNGNINQGAAYVFNETNGAWTQTTKLTASDGQPFDQFGRSVALNGATALIGAEFATVNGNDEQGAAYIFNESNGAWIQAQKLTASDGAAYDDFGSWVALDAATALIGADQSYVAGSARGSAYIFNESGDVWIQAQKLTASDGAEDSAFGVSVAFDGATALIGADLATVNGNPGQGAAYFYGKGDVGLAVSAPETVEQGQDYVSQTIATNNASVASPAVTAIVTLPAAAVSFISATPSQGICSEAPRTLTCAFGLIAGNGGTATANVTLKATGGRNTVIRNQVHMNASPPLTASAPTTISTGGSCPLYYTEYDGTLDAHQLAQIVSYQAAAGEENAILSAPAGFQLYVRMVIGGKQKLRRIPGNEIYRHGPAGTYTWGAKAGDTGGSYTLCIEHP